MTANASPDRLRTQLALALDWGEAHVALDKAIDSVPRDKQGGRAAGFEHSPWQLLEHIRIAQEDILDFCINAAYEHTMKWPEDYWPKDPAPPSQKAWTESIASCVRSREGLKRLARDVEDLTARVPTGKGNQTYLRAILLAADHAAYHVGQLVAVRCALAVWPVGR
jgi:DinB family protein